MALIAPQVGTCPGVSEKTKEAGDPKAGAELRPSWVSLEQRPESDRMLLLLVG